MLPSAPLAHVRDVLAVDAGKKLGVAENFAHKLVVCAYERAKSLIEVESALIHRLIIRPWALLNFEFSETFFCDEILMRFGHGSLPGPASL